MWGSPQNPMENAAMSKAEEYRLMEELSHHWRRYERSRRSPLGAAPPLRMVRRRRVVSELPR